MSLMSYSQSEFPPFPATMVELEYLLGVTDPAPAKIDTGATRTIAPTGLLDQAGAIRTGRTVVCLSYDGQARSWPLYEVTVRVCDERWPDGIERQFDNALVLGVEGQAEVLLG
ncbi:MAG: hypothetical protein ACQER1_01345, partial [Armatimonadota bacterium]